MPVLKFSEPSSRLISLIAPLKVQNSIVPMAFFFVNFKFQSFFFFPRLKLKCKTLLYAYRNSKCDSNVMQTVLQHHSPWSLGPRWLACQLGYGHQTWPQWCHLCTTPQPAHSASHLHAQQWHTGGVVRRVRISYIHNGCNAHLQYPSNLITYIWINLQLILFSSVSILNIYLIWCFK